MFFGAHFTPDICRSHPVFARGQSVQRGHPDDAVFSDVQGPDVVQRLSQSLPAIDAK